MGAGDPEPTDVKPLYDAPRIAARVDELAQEIASAGLQRLVIVAVLKGSFIFAADLIRALHARGLAPEIDFIFLASYGAGTTSQGSVKVLRDVGTALSGRDVVLVDDILDSGRTLAFAKDLLLQRGASRVMTCVLIDKQGVERAVPIEADYTGFACPPEFVVGYGMDLAHRYRELPYIGVVAKETAAALEPSEETEAVEGAET
ncbi:MAG: hypoxanthine phosphoribosyltransferase [Methyloligella sp. ZOD6]